MQVTAQTAISERPKAKANKPSARKHVQLQLQQQQLQQQLQQQQQQLQQQQQAAGSSGISSAVVPPPGTAASDNKVLINPPIISSMAQGTVTTPVTVTSPPSSAIPGPTQLHPQPQLAGNIVGDIQLQQQPFSTRVGIATAAATGSASSSVSPGGQLDAGIKLPVVPTSPPAKV